MEIVSPKFIKYCPILETERKQFPIMVDDTSCHLSCYTSTHASIWHCYGDMAPQIIIIIIISEHLYNALSFRRNL